jgi:hypothetical protein
LTPNSSVALVSAYLIDILIEREVKRSAGPMLADLWPSGPVTCEQAKATWDVKLEIERRINRLPSLHLRTATSGDTTMTAVYDRPDQQQITQHPQATHGIAWDTSLTSGPSGPPTAVR